MNQNFSEHGKNPTIIIDLKELNKILGDRANRQQSFEAALTNGGRFQKFNELLEYFFGEMKGTGANLVFIARLNEGRYKDVKAFKSSSLRPNERLWYNMLHSICSKYGDVHVNYGMDKCAILAYARENQANVMALITRNTEFLVYDGDYQLWSLADVNFRHLKIAQFHRENIYATLEVDTEQLQLMLAISELNPSTQRVLVGEKEPKLPVLIRFVQQLQRRRNGYDINQLATNLSENQRNELENELSKVLSIKNFNGIPGILNEDIYNGLILDLVNNDEPFDLVLQFCKQNIYFAYKLMNETSTIQKDLLLIDICQPEALLFIDIVIDVTMKMCGIIFKDVESDKKPDTRSVKFQRIRGEPAVQYEMDIIYPTSK